MVKKIFLGSFLFILFLGVVIGVTSGNESPTTATNGSETTVSAPAASEETGPLPAGETSRVDGLEVTASVLTKQSEFSSKYLCSDVSYVNNSDETVRYSSSDWKLQDPDKNITTSTLGPERYLSGELAPGGKVNGGVCFADPSLKGIYRIQNEEQFSFNSDTTEWLAEVK